MTSPPLQELLLDLTNLDKNVRMDAAVALGTLGDVAAVPTLVEALGSDQDFFVCETITWALVRCGSDSVEPVIALLKDGSPIAQVRAAHALGKLGDGRAVSALIAHLNDADLALREKCIMALGNIGGNEAKTALVALLGSESAELSTAVTRALEVFGEVALVALAERIGDEDPRVRSQVVDLLGFTGSKAAVPYLCAAAEDEEVSVRISALTALGSLNLEKQKEIQTVLTLALKDPDRRVQLLAERLLAR